MSLEKNQRGEGNSLEESLRRIRRETKVRYFGGSRALMRDTHRNEDMVKLNQSSPILLCRANEDGTYRVVPHLVVGDLGAIALGATCFRPRDSQNRGDSGWFGTGSNRFKVDYALLVEGVVFHLGEVTRGGFHEDKGAQLSVYVESRIGS